MSNAHSAELAYLFDFTLGDKPLTPTQERLSDQMMRYWAAFARNGNPAFRGAPTWPTYGIGRVLSAAQRRCQQGHHGRSRAEHNCDFWLGSTTQAG